VPLRHEHELARVIDIDRVRFDGKPAWTGKLASLKQMFEDSLSGARA